MQKRYYKCTGLIRGRSAALGPIGAVTEHLARSVSAPVPTPTAATGASSGADGPGLDDLLPVLYGAIERRELGNVLDRKGLTAVFGSEHKEVHAALAAMAGWCEQLDEGAGDQPLDQGRCAINSGSGQSCIITSLLK